MNVHRALLAAVWIAVGLSKAINPGPLTQYFGEQWGVSAGAAPTLAWMVITFEISIGVLLLVTGSGLAGTALCYASLLSCALLIAVALLSQDETPCGCFGELVKATRHRRLLVLACMLYLAAASLRARGRKSTGTISPA